MRRRAFLAALLAAPAAAALPLRGLVSVPPLQLPVREIYARFTFNGIPWVVDPCVSRGVIWMQTVRNEMESLILDIQTRAVR